MGYYAHSVDGDFLTKQRNIEPMIRAIKDGYKNYSFITDHDNVEGLFGEFGLDVTFDDRNGDIDGVWFCDQKFGSDEMEEFLSVIAPFVEAGSYIAFQGEDDSIWAYYFDGEKCLYYPGRIDFPNMPAGGPVRR